MNEMNSYKAAEIVKDLAPGSTQIKPFQNHVHLPDLTKLRGFQDCWPYHSVEGDICCLVARFERMSADGTLKKQILPYTLWQQPNGEMVWACKQMEGERPLFDLLTLLKQPDAVVLLSEGEKCASAARFAFPNAVSSTWAGGCNAVRKTDFSPLRGRDVILFPDNDTPGLEAMQKIREILRDVGAKRVRQVDIAGLAMRVLGSAPEKCDIADLADAGLDSARFEELLRAHPELLVGCAESAEEKPSVSEMLSASDPEAPAKESDPLEELMQHYGRIPDLPSEFELNDCGLFKLSINRNGQTIHVFCGSPLVVMGRTRNRRGGGWGHLVAFRTPEGTWDHMVIPARELAGDGRQLRAMLADRGVVTPQDRAGRQGLGEFISRSLMQAGNAISVTEHPGWVDDCFVLPGRVFAPTDRESEVVLELEGRPHLFNENGEFENWKQLAEMAEGNSRAAFSLSAALAGPLMTPLGEEGGGFHFFGPSSSGKSTLLQLAGSVWGGGGRDGFCRSWRMTDNGGEGLAADHNDTLLVLDELGQADAERIEDIFYMLANGRGKSRATKAGSLQQAAAWRLMALSSGEVSAASQIQGSRRGGRRRVPAGVAIRMIDIPIQLDAEGRRSFESPSDATDERAFVERLSDMAQKHYGHAGPEFLQHLVSHRETMLQQVENLRSLYLSELIPAGDDAQVVRVARRFALVAAAGEIARQCDVLPWSEGAAISAAKACFEAWRSIYGHGGSLDDQDAISALKRFFELHGVSRFEPLVTGRGAGNPDAVLLGRDRQMIRDRCGYRVTITVCSEDGEEQVVEVFYVTPEAWRSEICGLDRDPRAVANVAKACGALVCDVDGRLKKKVRLPDYPDGTRVYAIRPDLLP
ncbi:hypothetical protein BMI90_11595 [Thioclava sp. L04-15]|uniref:DUF927 domain-containing protein n=1 Tax=Thioclava sp. L04-15 TaxID=1915318 RepID=UPI00099878F5|nr:DUF927 domain-containing protein [Thioclava sp. L04-15]OOY27839.1 hypothetical protein BMI90_11595 [Thioclava sp. L04-15]